MPHAESDTMGTVVNGETPSSAFLHHLVSYPVVNDSISTFKSYPLGSKSISIADTGFHKLQSLSAPFVPYLEKPYAYLQPYVHKADEIGDNTLASIDSRFPAVKKPTNELYDEAHGLATFPLRKTLEGKDYVLKTYGSERKKVGGDGLVTSGKAVISTGLILSAESLDFLRGWFASAKQTAAAKTTEKQ